MDNRKLAESGRRIEVRGPKCRLVLTPAEIEALLRDHPDVWVRALKRGKAVKRAESMRKRTKGGGVMSKRSLTLAEQETVIRRSADEDHWDVYSCNPSMVKKLRRMSIQMDLEATKVDDYGWRFTLPINALSFRVPRKATEAQREHLARIGAKAKEAAAGVSQ